MCVFKNIGFGAGWAVREGERGEGRGEGGGGGYFSASPVTTKE